VRDISRKNEKPDGQKCTAHQQSYQVSEVWDWSWSDGELLGYDLRRAQALIECNGVLHIDEFFFPFFAGLLTVGHRPPNPMPMTNG